jgi:ABC-type branched-subunit amino acid transport system substrate-binding protein
MKKFGLAGAGLALAATLAAVVATAGASVQAKRPIVIGVDTSITGPFAALGVSTTRGIVMRVRQINNAGGVNGRKLKPVILDDATNPATSVTNTQRLIAQGVDAIIGYNGGQTQVPAMAMLERAKILTISLGGYNAGSPTGPTYFFSSPSLTAHVGALSCYVTKAAKAVEREKASMPQELVKRALLESQRSPVRSCSTL